MSQKKAAELEAAASDTEGLQQGQPARSGLAAQGGSAGAKAATAAAASLLGQKLVSHDDAASSPSAEAPKDVPADTTRAAAAAQVARMIKNLAAASSLDVLSQSSRMRLGQAIATAQKYPELEQDSEFVAALAALRAHAPLTPAQTRAALTDEMNRRAAENATRQLSEDERVELGAFLFRVYTLAASLLKSDAAVQLNAHDPR